jgi:hypothetical protein
MESPRMIDLNSLLHEREDYSMIGSLAVAKLAARQRATCRASP